VGLVLAEYANKQGFAWPSARTTLAQRCRLNERTVRRALRGLVCHRFLVVARECRGRTTTYQLVLPECGSSDRTPAVTAAHPVRSLAPLSAVAHAGSAVTAPPELRRSGKNLSASGAALASAGSAAPNAQTSDAPYLCPFCTTGYDQLGHAAACIQGHLEEDMPLPRLTLPKRPHLDPGEPDDRGDQTCRACRRYDIERVELRSGPTCLACLVLSGQALVNNRRWDDRTRQWETAA
jgi:hypothetical protein